MALITFIIPNNFPISLIKIQMNYPANRSKPRISPKYISREVPTTAIVLEEYDCLLINEADLQLGFS